MVVVLAATSLGTAAVVQVDMTVDPATPTVNTMLMTLDLTLGTGSPAAIDTATTVVSGTTKLNLDLTFDPVSHAASVSSIEFLFEAGLNPLALSDMTGDQQFYMDFYPPVPGYMTLTADGVGIGGTLKQTGTDDYLQGPPAAVTGGVFDVAEVQAFLDQGTFTLGGTLQQPPAVWNLATPASAAVADLATGDGAVSVTMNSIVGGQIIYDVNVTMPFDATFIIWNPSGGGRMGYLTSDGTMSMSGQLATAVPEPSTIVGLVTLVLAGLVALRRR